MSSCIDLFGGFSIDAVIRNSAHDLVLSNESISQSINNKGTQSSDSHCRDT